VVPRSSVKYCKAAAIQTLPNGKSCQLTAPLAILEEAVGSVES